MTILQFKEKYGTLTPALVVKRALVECKCTADVRCIACFVCTMLADLESALSDE